MKKLGAAALVAVVGLSTLARGEQGEIVKDAFTEEMEWFKDAKLGIFIHWGIYAVDGTVESWPIFRGDMSYEDYMSQIDGFTASKYDPESWAELFKEAGARYAVLTAKHHDGVALWDTAQLTGGKKLSVVEQAPAGRDLVGPYCEALRRNGLKVGLYFSHLDWSHPDYSALKRNGGNRFNTRAVSDYDAWERFLAFHRGQLWELCENYHPDLFWFDGDWDHSAETWRMKELRAELKRRLPNVILNARMGGYGDYETPEQGIPVTAPEGSWELCLTMNDHWGYKPDDENYKSTAQLVRIFAECISMGGNLLLDIGPREDGTICEEQSSRLKEMGAWIRKNEEAIYGTVGGLERIHYGAPSTFSKDRKTIYLFVFDKPGSQLLLKGLRNKPTSITVLGSEEKLGSKRVGGASWKNIPGALFIDTPPNLEVGLGTVVKIELAEPMDLYSGKSGAIEQN